MSHVLRVRRGHTGLPNATVYDDALSYRALGLLLAMLARPDVGSFDIRILSRGEGREGRDALLAASKELRRAGYVHQFKLRNNTGRTMTVTVVDDRPVTIEDALAEVPPGSGFQTPVHQTPVHQTPAESTPSLRESTSLREEEIQRERARNADSTTREEALVAMRAAMRNALNAAPSDACEQAEPDTEGAPA